jgi:hypothetical protein
MRAQSMTSARRNLVLVMAAVAALPCACSRSPVAAPPFEVVRTSPRLESGATPVLLNDALTIYFSAPIHPLSVTTDSVTLVDEAGHLVPGTLAVGSNWVTFQPIPPLSPTLDDGSFRPGAAYRLLLAGSPRPDAIRAADDRRLSSTRALPVRIARRDEAPPGLPAPLRPPGVDLPFLLRAPDAQFLQIPANAPRLQLHFTQPVLPPSAVPAAVDVMLLSELCPLVPRSVRVLTSRLDEFPGSTIEVDLGPRPRRADGSGEVVLGAGDVISITVRQGPQALLDLSGAAVLPGQQFWGVVAGDDLALIEWPQGGEVFEADGGMVPGFEVHQGAIRPRVRVEAGDGSLGVFRPRADLVLRPGVPFDRGDGTVVVSRGNEFPFQAIDIPADVHVVLDAGPGAIVLRSLADVRIRGRLSVRAPSAPLPAAPGQLVPVRDLIANTPASIVAAGNVLVDGPILAAAAAIPEHTPLLLASAGAIELAAPVPFHTLLAFEDAGLGGAEHTGVRGPRGQALLVPALFTYGVPDGADFAVRGVSPWRQLPADRDGGVIQLRGPAADLQVAWQVAPPDAVRSDRPDLAVGRVGRWNVAADRAVLGAAASSFLRFELSARAVSGRPLPRLDGLRLVSR